MAKRRINATAKNGTIEIRLSTSLNLDGLLMKSEQDYKVKKFKNGLYELLSGQGFHYEEIKIS